MPCLLQRTMICAKDCSTKLSRELTKEPLSPSSETSANSSVLKMDAPLKICTWEDLRRIHLLGQGAYADVYHMIENKKHPSSSSSSSRRNNHHYHHYAAKSLNKERMEEWASAEFVIAQADLASEASILSQLDHENIIKLRGISSSSILTAIASKEEKEENWNPAEHANEQGDLFLLFDVLQDTLKDRMDRWRRGPWNSKKLPRAASLDTLLNRVRLGVRRPRGGGQGSTYSNKDKDVNIDKMYARMQSVALPVVKAMKYLHQKEILHRDLKPANVGFLAADGGRVQLFDFGFARHVDACSKYEVAGTPRFIAPEVVEGHGYSFASDVYSFGVLLHELCTLIEASLVSAASCPPNKRHREGSVAAEQEGLDIKDSLSMVTRSLRQTSRLSLDSIPCRATKELIRVCVSKRPSDRPSFAVIEKTLNNILLEELDDDH